MANLVSNLAKLTSASVVTFFMVTAAFADDSKTEVGVLTCEVEGGFGLIIGSKKDMACTFKPAGDGPAEFYSGKIKRLGIDLGGTKHSVIKWGVLAPTNVMTAGVLAGSYGGVSGEVSIGGGVGANLLIGGSKNTIVLQPLSVQAQIGIDIAAGIAELSLKSMQ